MGVFVEKVREFFDGADVLAADLNQKLGKAEMVAANNSGSYIPSSNLCKIFGIDVAIEIEFGIRPKSCKP